MSEEAEILIVDDDPSIRRLCLRMLKRMGYTVADVSNGEKAVELVTQSDSFKLVLLDINLPDGSGYDWCEKLRSQSQDLSVVYFTGSTHLVKNNAGNGSLYLAKPFTGDDLRQVLDQAGLTK